MVKCIHVQVVRRKVFWDKHENISHAIAIMDAGNYRSLLGRCFCCFVKIRLTNRRRLLRRHVPSKSNELTRQLAENNDAWRLTRSHPASNCTNCPVWSVTGGYYVSIICHSFLSWPRVDRGEWDRAVNRILPTVVAWQTGFLIAKDQLTLALPFVAGILALSSEGISKLGNFKLGKAAGLLGRSDENSCSPFTSNVSILSSLYRKKTIRFTQFTLYIHYASSLLYNPRNSKRKIVRKSETQNSQNRSR